MPAINKNPDVHWPASQPAVRATQASMALERRSTPVGYERSARAQRALATLRRERGWA